MRSQHADAQPDHIAHLQARIAAALEPLIAGAQSIALLDFPDHDNVGDSAIWLGETSFVRRTMQRDPNYVCSAATYNPENLRRAAPTGPILLSGGGNFGDLYLLHQSLREQVCVDFPDRTIIQLPQSIHFQSSERLDAARRVIGAHKHFTLVARDETSLRVAQAFDCHTLLAPDMAFCLGALITSAQPANDLVALLRKDREAAGHPLDQIEMPASSRMIDWFVNHRPELHALEGYVRQKRGQTEAYEQVAEFRLARGIEILSSGERIVTDRLHGHLLAVLMARPSFLLDNTYAKNSSFFQTWREQLSVSGACGSVEHLKSWLGASQDQDGAA